MHKMLVAHRQTTKLEPRRFFQTLLKNIQGTVDLWLAAKEDRDVEANIVASNGGDTVYYVPAASAASEWSDCPGNLLLTSAIEDALTQGCHWFDFLANRGLTDVKKFKELLGGVSTPVSEYWLKWLVSILESKLKTHFDMDQ